MNSEIIAVGTELLHGDIANTNAQYISKELAKIGIDVHYHTVVGDNRQRIKNIFEIASNRADIIICTGGLGPTKDDITKEVLAEYLDIPMVFDQFSKQHIEDIFSSRNRIMTDNNLRQAYFPEGAKVLKNENGTANACILEKDEKVFILLPGPPREVQPLFQSEIANYLSNYSDEIVECVKIKVVNLGESTAETLVMDLIDSQTNPTIAPYAGVGRVVFRVTAKAETKEDALNKIEPVVKEMLRRFGDNGSILEEE